MKGEDRPSFLGKAIPKYVFLADEERLSLSDGGNSVDWMKRRRLRFEILAQTLEIDLDETFYRTEGQLGSAHAVFLQ